MGILGWFSLPDENGQSWLGRGERPLQDVPLRASIGIEKNAISIEIFNPDRKFQSRLKNFSWPSEFPTKIEVWWAARLKCSISLENFKILNFFNLWALRAPFRAFWNSVRERWCSNRYEVLQEGLHEPLRRPLRWAFCKQFSIARLGVQTPSLICVPSVRQFWAFS